MTTTEVRKASFTELQALTTRLITQAEALAGLVARPKLDATLGTGVWAFRVAFCGSFPLSTVVGIDPWELSLEMARQNVAVAGLASRITSPVAVRPVGRRGARAQSARRRPTRRTTCSARRGTG